MYNNNAVFDWNDVIEDDGQEFVLLEEGDYNFTVTNFERGHFPGSAKTPACNKATLTLEVDTREGCAYVKCDLFLCSSNEWKLSSFFRCIGQKKRGERLVMDWNKVIGSKGRVRIKPRPYTAKDGSQRFANDVDRFYDYDPAFFPKKQTPTWVTEAEKAPTQTWEQSGF